MKRLFSNWHSFRHCWNGRCRFKANMFWGFSPLGKKTPNKSCSLHFNSQDTHPENQTTTTKNPNPQVFKILTRKVVTNSSLIIIIKFLVFMFFAFLY